VPTPPTTRPRESTAREQQRAEHQHVEDEEPIGDELADDLDEDCVPGCSIARSTTSTRPNRFVTLPRL